MAARRRSISQLRRTLRPALLVAAMSAAAGSAATGSTARADESTREASTDATRVAAPDGWHRSTDPRSDSPVTESTSNVRLPAVVFAAGVLVIVQGVRNARQGT
jgi:hypothetical protein